MSGIASASSGRRWTGCCWLGDEAGIAAVGLAPMSAWRISRTPTAEPIRIPLGNTGISKWAGGVPGVPCHRLTARDPVYGFDAGAGAGLRRSRWRAGSGQTPLARTKRKIRSAAW